ncbi:hypothetical protein [Dactylosporangium darangshiense]|uniref:hypothetical protein n=1 Tax=Dactylosporangium darangshiense TaxID=579108 RepID=UPI0031F067CA
MIEPPKAPGTVGAMVSAAGVSRTVLAACALGAAATTKAKVTAHAAMAAPTMRLGRLGARC